MQRESISTSTFVKGIAAGVIVAASLGTLQYAEYSTRMKSGSYDFVPGTYTASADGMDGPVYVTVTVDDSTITDVKVDVSGETPGIGAEISEEVASQILGAQSSAIDGVAGATVSSDAVRNALDKAVGYAEAGEEGETAPVSEETEAASETEAAASEDATEAAAAASGDVSYVPGTYTGTGTGMDGDVTAEVTVDDHSITDVKVDVSGETPGIGTEIADEIQQQFLDAQSADVAGVSGATVSSTAARDAVADALSQAMGGAIEDVTEAAAAPTGDASYVAGTYTGVGTGMDGDVTAEVTVDDHSITDVKVDVSGETPGIGTEIADEIQQQFLDAQSADVAGVSGATVSSTAARDAVADALAQAAGGSAEAVSEAAASTSYNAGTYTGKAKGLHNYVTVEVTIDENSAITDVKADASGEGVDASVIEEIQNQFIDAQSADIEGVADAHYTSEGLKKAMEDALNQASGAAPAAEAVSEAVASTSYKAGTYTGKAKGLHNYVTVEVTIDENSAITDVKADASGEGVDASVIEEIQQQFIEAQSADVEGVADAHYTSEGLKKAMEDALTQATN